MSNEYTHLTGQDILSLRHRRLRALEADHVLACLVLEEDPEDPRAREDAAELWRRIGHHRERLASALRAGEPATEPAGEPEPDDTANKGEPAERPATGDEAGTGEPSAHGEAPREAAMT